ncbi:MAG: adenosine deaminase [Coriobacteriia bacterium]|nr:adenosine deaminase [Coriobacteriia bacterium]
MPHEELIESLPKVELHLHLEGTLEPELAFELGGRNGVALPYSSVSEMRGAYSFTDLQSFLDIYYASCSVLLRAQDFYDLTAAYLERAHADRVRHVEPFFDPQTHTSRGVPFEEVVDGISRALDDGRSRFGITSRLIMCVLRDLPADDGMRALESALDHPGRIAGIGLDSGELGNPPAKFTDVYARARAHGLRAVAHAGEEGPAAYISESLDVLCAERIDHGVRCLEDPVLVKRLVRERTCLTVCPTSNVALRVSRTMADHPLRRMLEAGLAVTVNSDDPAYFGGYIGENYRAVTDALGLDATHLTTLASNAIEGSFADEARKSELRRELESVQAP